MLTNSLSTWKMVVAPNMSFSHSPREGTGIGWKWQMAGAEGIPGKAHAVAREDISVHGHAWATA